MPIGAKLIATTTLLVLLLVGLFGFMNVMNTGRLFDEQAEAQRQSFKQSLRKRGLVQVRDLAEAGRNAITNNDWKTLEGFVPGIAKDDQEIAYVFIADSNGLINAHSIAARNGKPVSEPIDIELTQSPSEVVREIQGKHDKLYVFSKPVLADGVRVGTVILAYTLRMLDATIEKLEQDKVLAFRASWIRTSLIGLLFILVGTAMAIFQGLRISRPLRQLALRADQIAGGDLKARVAIRRRDELGLLGANFNYMADRISILVSETAEKAVLEKELEVARTIQDSLVPPPTLVDRGFIQLAGYFLPASQCGGDWWTVHDLPDGRVLVLIGDVTGHGVPSAMITAAAKAACDVVRATEGERLTAPRLLEVMNRAIFESAHRRFVMTCFASIIDPVQQTITFSNAGHNFPYLYRPGAADGNEFQVLMSRGNRLGDLEESRYDARVLKLQRGDLIVWYTDGLVECENKKGEEFGEKRFRAAIRASAGLDPIGMRDRITSTANDFFGSRARKDDITMVVARVLV
jgi:serine phosphatase RsbU (regulator of sigma subunit)